MVPLDVCPTEDAVQVFLEHLVDPLLPARSSVRDNPSLDQQQSVAKQVHSVVLLYNYYHRKQHPELTYLPFNEFGKLTVLLRPALLAYMQFMQKLNEVELNDVEKELSLTEKTMMDACDICRCLDASKNVPDIEGWPIIKVAILLIDSKKEYCFLLFGFITNGVWSLVEKSLDTSSQSSEVTSGNAYKKKRIIRKPTKDELKVDEAGILQVGYSAIKEATGIDTTDIMLLESHTVYSQSKEKAASRFYIMQCSQLIKQEVIQVPLKDVVKSLQGPLIEKSSSRWTITPVVDYFHVLPYSRIISKWISRETFSNSLADSRVREKNIMVYSTEVTESYANKDTFTGLESKPSSDDIKLLMQKENNGSCTSDSIKKLHEMDMNKSSIFASQNTEKDQYIANTVQVGENQEKKNLSVQNNSNGSASVKDLEVNSTKMLSTEGGISNLSPCRNICANRLNTSSEHDPVDDCTRTANDSNSDLEKFRILLDSKNFLSQTALAAMIQKRNGLVIQQREIEDEIAICDKKLQRMLTDGADDFELQIESIVEGCNDMWVRNHEKTRARQSSPLKRKKLSEAVFTTQSPCQELDGVCQENNWVLPTYHLSQSNGGIQAKVSVQGVEFQCSSEGTVCSNPVEARESAAARMLSNLRNMAKLAQ